MYKLQNKYQDEGWADLGKTEEYDSYGAACGRAHVLAGNSICYGMVRVINKNTNEVMVEYPAGGEDTLTSVKPEQAKSKKGQDSVREGFEEWMAMCCFDATKHAGGGYNNHDADIWWEVWQAACKWEAEQAIKNYYPGGYTHH